ncbi:related to formin binding protein [Rhynchosporium graminicola]|uniref:Related to formin binding protein n=1 Tax=Rhynchosporium graminicola TaxID=2792576 RepID=A0A1E1JUT5_9HELO|nr:related to formin binding protein [Rhynchosporium commune]
MSEYWKSTPKYWCKHCKTYVRDTKLEKTNHEATPKHQGNLKRFLRDLHRNHEKDEKDKERSKMEVERLKGLVSGGGSSSALGSSSSAFGRGPTPSVPRQYATEAQRKKQLAQLAEMGVEIPSEVRSDMAMPGEWQVTSERVIDPEGTEKKPDALALGVRKREADEEEAELIEAKKRRWGSAYRTHPTEEKDDGLDDLLNNATWKGKELATKDDGKAEVKEEIKDGAKQESDKPELGEPSNGPTEDAKFDDAHLPGIKRELPDGDNNAIGSLLPIEGVMQEAEEPTVTGVVFKKRKAKNIRQKGGVPRSSILY